MGSPHTPFLFVTTTLPGTGAGAMERSASMLEALRAIRPTRVLLLRHDWHPPIARGSCDHVLDAIAPGASERFYHWRRRFPFGPLRTESRLTAALARILEHEPAAAIICRYPATLALDAPRFAPSLIDIDDIPSDTEGNRLLATLGRHALGHALRGYRTVFVTKPADTRKVLHANVRVLPCISTSAHPLPDTAHAHNLLFLGSHGHLPNAHGVARFVERAWPRILRHYPDATLTLGGTGWERYAGRPGVRTPGFIESLEQAYRSALVVVCPIWSGTGACVKLAEAAGFGRPVVASVPAAAGYEGILEAERDILTAADDDAFADACIRLLGDEGLRTRLGRSAQVRAATSLSVAAVERILRAALAPSGLCEDQRHE